ncbi:MAG: tail fiber protein [Alphaproteobacteria bacterium]|nr:tail fiber protein [Alphaproteobacteria bacterium]
MAALKTKGVIVRLAGLVVLAGGFLLPSPARACGPEPYIGEICSFAGTYCPEGYLPADGRTVPISSHQALYSLLGSRFGGNGSSTFALPDMREQKSAGGQYLSVCIAVQGLYPPRGETAARSTTSPPATVTPSAQSNAVPAGSPVTGACQDAQLQVDKMIAHYQRVGRDLAFADFMRRDSDWFNAPQVGAVATKDGLFKVHPNFRLVDNPDMVKLKDVNGLLVVEEMIKSATQSPAGGWAQYTWTHPEARKLAVRREWVKVHDGLMFMATCYP